MNWDIRSLFSILDPISRIYVFSQLLTAIWMIAIPFRVSHWLRRQRARGIQVAEITQRRLSGLESHLRQFFTLNVIFFCACVSNQILLGVRSMETLTRNPNIDAVPPFDALFAVSQLGFVGLAVIHSARWFVSAKVMRSREEWKQF
jgi:hypothetical protein